MSVTKTVDTLPLDERIPIALTQPLTSADVAAVRGEAEEALADLIAKAGAADIASLSPLATREQAAAMRAQATEMRWDADRLEASVAALSARAADLRDRERRAETDAQVAEVTAERDALAADIVKRYPEVVATLTDLARRIVANDRRCAQTGIRQGAESIARQSPTTGTSSSGTLYAADNGGWIIPIPQIRINPLLSAVTAYESTMAGWRFYDDDPAVEAAHQAALARALSGGMA